MPEAIKLGTITLGERIGGGGYGEVFKAKLEPLKGDLAVKILNPSLFHSDAGRVRQRFIKEAEILMGLRHEKITPIFGVGEDQGRPFILMEYFAGFDLQRARDEHGAPEDPMIVLPFVDWIAQALGHAHQRGVVHRDVKPTNLLTRKGDARVVDFGIAQIVDPDGERFTRTGGTPVGGTFAAPELVDNPRLIDPRCDIYSLGASWFWLLTGTTPRGRSWEAALRGIDKMTKPYEAVLLKTLEQAEKRYQTMEELARDVRALRTGTEPKGTADDDLDDETTLLIGVLFEQLGPEGEATSTYTLEQQLAGRLTRFSLNMGLRTLGALGFTESVTVAEWNGDPWTGLKLTHDGEEWVVANRARVERELDGLRAATQKEQAPDDDDIPF